MCDLAIQYCGHRWFLDPQNPFIRDWLEQNAPAGTSWFDGRLIVAPHHADAIIGDLRALGMLPENPYLEMFS